MPLGGMFPYEKDNPVLRPISNMVQAIAAQVGRATQAADAQARFASGIYQPQQDPIAQAVASAIQQGAASNVGANVQRGADSTGGPKGEGDALRRLARYLATFRSRFEDTGGGFAPPRG
jgi:hypothetical protein